MVGEGFAGPSSVAAPPVDRERLIAQGIDTSELVPGAQHVDALGSCTCNAGTVSLAERWRAAGQNRTEIRIQDSQQLPFGLGFGAADNEEFAIVLYHVVTDQTGSPSTDALGLHLSTAVTGAIEGAAAPAL